MLICIRIYNAGIGKVIWDHLAYLVMRSSSLSCVEIILSILCWDHWVIFCVDPARDWESPFSSNGGLDSLSPQPPHIFTWWDQRKCTNSIEVFLPDAKWETTWYYLSVGLTMQGLWPWGTLAMRDSWALPMDNDLILLPFNPLDSTPNMHTHHTHILTFSRGFLSGNKILP